MMPRHTLAFVSLLLSVLSAVPGAHAHSPGFYWPSEPPEGCPFEPSETLIGIYFTGRHSDYHTGDTIYPSWASDGNLYTPWTDGKVNGVRSISWSGKDATTGQAVMIGDDPLNLTIENTAPPFPASALPYQGRYPAGSLVHNGIWYYATYCLGPGGGYMHNGFKWNWPNLGPVSGFRISYDYGKTWTPSPHSPEKPLFPEPARQFGPVKMGAPHFVDFGKNMEHSPDGKAYLLGMGAEENDPLPRPCIAVSDTPGVPYLINPECPGDPIDGFAHANLSWITADQVYLARVTPSPETINDENAYEYFAGHDENGEPVWTDDFAEIKPLIEWNNHMGCVTATWVPGLQKYLMCITDGWPTVAQMDSYILEADEITGPWRLVTYMRHFGEQGYFLNFPSKFISPDGKTLWLCYSANFSPDWNGVKLHFNPPGGRYGLSLHEVRLLDRASVGPLSQTVRTIDWERFPDAPPSPELQLSSRLMANAARYAHTWANTAYESTDNDDRFLIPNRNNEHDIRPATSAALGLAVTVRTGVSEEAVGVPHAALARTAAKLIKGAAATHKANGGAWGDHWQSALWAAQLGRAGWMLWEHLDPETREMVCRAIVHEADRHLAPDYRVPYWNGEGGDSKAEENSWESMVLQVAIAMLPDHPNNRAWREICSELHVSAYSLESDMHRAEPLIDGRAPRDWLRGYNVRADGIVINHGLVHNDYMASIAHLQMGGLTVFPLAGLPAPESIDFNFATIYRTLVTKRFESPPWEAPGGTMYIPDSPEQYYPQGTDWSRYRYACFYGMDTIADILGYDEGLPHRAAHWRELRARRILEMQSRHPDGRMYADGEFDRYPGREQMIFWMIADAHLLQWLADRNALTGKANWLGDTETEPSPAP